MGDGSSVLYTVDGRNPAACGIVEPLSMLFCISTIERVAEFLPSTVWSTSTWKGICLLVTSWYFFYLGWFGIRSNSERDFLLTVSLELQKVQTETMKSKLGKEGKGSKLTKLVLFVLTFPARNNWLSLSEWQTATTAATTTGLLFHPIWSTYRWWFSEFNVEQSCQIMRVQVRVDSEMIHLDIVMLCFYVCTVLPKSQRCRNDNGCL